MPRNDHRLTEEECAELLRRRAKGQEPAAPEMLEMDLQAEVRKLAKLFHWLCYHTYRSDRSDFGFPDLTMVKGGRVIFVELKSAKPKPTDEQQKWLDALSAVGRPVEVYVWRPADLMSGVIATTLSNTPSC